MVKIIVLDPPYESVREFWRAVGRSLDATTISCEFKKNWFTPFIRLENQIINSELAIKSRLYTLLPGVKKLRPDLILSQVYKDLYNENDLNIWIVTMPYLKDICGFMNNQNNQLIYYVVDDYSSSFNLSSNQLAFFIKVEQQLIDAAACVIAVSKALTLKLRQRYPGAAHKIFYISNGTVERFDLEPAPYKEGKIVIGYLGSITGRIDWNIVDYICKNIKNSEIHLFGPTPKGYDLKCLIGLTRKHDNCIFHGRVPVDEVPQTIASFHISIIPEPLNEFNRMGSPQKLWNSLAVGLPIVSTRIPEQSQFPDLVYFGDNPEDFAKAIQQAIIELKSSDRARILLRKSLAQSKYWSKLGDEAAEIMRSVI